MKTLTKTLLAFAILLLTFSNTKAQDDCKDCGIVIDNILVDSLHCFNTASRYYVFPVNPEWFKYDIIEIGEFRIRPDGTQTSYMCKFLKKQEFIDNFGKSQLGVLRIPNDKVIEMVEELEIATIYVGYWWSYTKEKGNPDYMPRKTVVQIRGRYIEGEIKNYKTGYVTKAAAYGKPTILWQSKPIPGVMYGQKNEKFSPEHQPFVYNPEKSNLGTCTNKGKPFPYKMESANYSTEYFIIKN